MSYTTIIAIWPNEKIEDFEELRNSHGSAPVIWNAMCKKYFGSEDHRYMIDGTLDLLWPCWKDLRIPKYQRAVLMMTADRSYVLKKDYQRAADDIKAFLRDFPVGKDYVNHWPRIAEVFESQPDFPAIGFHCTSVSENPFNGDWNEDKEEYDPPNWDLCYDIYSELDGLRDA